LGTAGQKAGPGPGSREAPLTSWKESEREREPVQPAEEPRSSDQASGGPERQISMEAPRGAFGFGGGRGRADRTERNSIFNRLGPRSSDHQAGPSSGMAAARGAGFDRPERLSIGRAQSGQHPHDGHGAQNGAGASERRNSLVRHPVISTLHQGVV
jgi:hypothetical protein